MGCGASSSAVKYIIPDPMEDKCCTFQLKMKGMMSAHWFALNAEGLEHDRNGPKDKWYLINKETVGTCRTWKPTLHCTPRLHTVHV